MVLNPLSGLPSALEQHAPSRPRTSETSEALKKGGGSAFRLTEYQQFFPGTPAYARPFDRGVNKEIVEFYGHKIAPKKPLLVSGPCTTEYLENFKKHNQTDSPANAHYPFENSKSYKRDTATPKSYSHDQFGIHNTGYAQVRTKCEPEVHQMFTGGSCELWASSYQKEHTNKIAKPGKDKRSKKNTHQATTDMRFEGNSTPQLGVKELWKMMELNKSSYELSYVDKSSASSSEVSLRASTAPGRARQFKLRKDPAQLPSMNAHENRKGRALGYRSSKMHSSTPNLPAVS